MGFPYEYQFKDCESIYLSLEVQVLSEILDYLDTKPNFIEDHIVVVTTVSVIYTGHKLLERHRQITIVMHFSSSSEIQAKMLERYLANKRPVLWRNLFDKRPSESYREAFARCYQRLLVAREELYQQYSHVPISYRWHAQNSLRGLNFISMILPQLKGTLSGASRNLQMVSLLD